MSWLFGGYNKGQGGQVPPGLVPPPAGSGGSDGGAPGSSDKSKMDAYRFDSAALERAAEAAKTLERSSKNNAAVQISLFIFLILQAMLKIMCCISYVVFLAVFINDNVKVRK